MKHFLFLSFFSLFMLGCSVSSPIEKKISLVEKKSFTELQKDTSLEQAFFSGGCFWCSEDALQNVEGVGEVFSGYMGGGKENAKYKSVASGKTKHRESIVVFYDPQKTSYKKLVQAFWKHIDPTDSGGQFADRGFQYTAAIYYSNNKEQKVAETSKKQIEDSREFSVPISVLILPVTQFYPAEEYHQDYSDKNPAAYNRYKKGSGRADYIHEVWDKSTIFSSSSISLDAMKQSLTPLQYKVTQENGTERPFDNKYWDNKQEGIYVDIVSGEVLFSSKDKFVSGTGWPSFTKPLKKENMVEKKDSMLGIVRTEVRSKKADSHLGHIFSDGPSDKGGLRYCINSASLRFIPQENLEKEGYGEWR